MCRYKLYHVDKYVDRSDDLDEILDSFFIQVEIYIQEIRDAIEDGENIDSLSGVMIVSKEGEIISNFRLSKNQIQKLIQDKVKYD